MNAWLYGYVDTDHPGYRKVTLGASAITVGAGYYRWDALVTAVNSAVSGAGWGLASTSTGITTLTKGSGTASVTWPDRLGWVLGFNTRPGTSEGTVGALTSRAVPPAAIPLLGATWDDVEVRKDTQFVVDRNLRGHGYVFGTSRVWRWRLVMSSGSLDALKTGWCLNGKVVISPANPTGLGADTAWSSSNTDGYVEGVPIGVESVRWIDSLQTVAEVMLLMTVVGP